MSSNKLMKLLVFVSFSAIKLSDGADTYCDNNCQPPAVNGGFYCVLTNPSKYTVCSNGVRVINSCPSTLYWDSSVNACNWPALSKPCSCSFTNTTTSTTTTSTTTTKTSSTVTSSSATSSSTTTTSSSSSSNKVTVCYYSNWAQYRFGASFTPNNIDPSLCTHIVYAFLNFNVTWISLREWNDDTTISKILAFKSSYPNLKLLASIGGWNAGTSVFQQIIASSASRSTFNQNAITFLRQYKFDGLDVDYEYPGLADKSYYTAWMQSLASAFASEATASGKARLLLTAAIGAGKSTIDSGYDIPSLSSALDLITVMTYDFHGSWDSVTGYCAPLYPLSSWASGSTLAQFTTSYAINYLLSLGASPSKLVLGIPFYGRSFTLTNANNNGIGAAASGAGLAGTWTQSPGMNAYYETCMLAKCTTTPYSYIYDSTIKGPYMFSGKNWISTEDINSVTAKVQFAVQKSLAGVMFWALDFDDFNDMCSNGVKYPLLKAANNALRGLAPPTLNAAGSSTMCSAVVVSGR